MKIYKSPSPTTQENVQPNVRKHQNKFRKKKKGKETMEKLRGAVQNLNARECPVIFPSPITVLRCFFILFSPTVQVYRKKTRVNCKKCDSTL